MNGDPPNRFVVVLQDQVSFFKVGTKRKYRANDRHPHHLVYVFIPLGTAQRPWAVGNAHHQLVSLFLQQGTSRLCIQNDGMDETVPASHLQCQEVRGRCIVFHDIRYISFLFTDHEVLWLTILQTTVQLFNELFEPWFETSIDNSKSQKRSHLSDRGNVTQCSNSLSDLPSHHQFAWGIKLSQVVHRLMEEVKLS